VEFSVTKQYVDRKQMPRIWVEDGTFTFNYHYITMNIVSDDVGP